MFKIWWNGAPVLVFNNYQYSTVVILQLKFDFSVNSPNEFLQVRTHQQALDSLTVAVQNSRTTPVL